MKKSILLSVGLSLALGQSLAFAQAPFKQQSSSHQEGLPPQLLLKAKLANERHQKKGVLIVDVRSRMEYNMEHIKNAISYPYRAIQETDSFPFKKDQPLLMYCGCPHHLSGLSAQKLLGLGYKDVKVIDEGYFGWKDQGFKVALGQSPDQKMSQEVTGRLRLANQSPAAFEDIFLLHPQTGQLEATRTDAQGQFKMTLHFAEVGIKDTLQFHLLNRTPVKEVTLKELQGPLDLEIQEHLAFVPSEK